MTVFKNLPAWEDFSKSRSSDILRMRLAFTSMLQQMHPRTLATYTDMMTPEQEAAAHERWSAEQSQRPKTARREGLLLPCRRCSI